MKNIKDKLTPFVALLFFGACASKSINQPVALAGPFKNVEIDKASLSTGPCEPTISINPTNPNNIAAGSVLDRFYISDDGGLNWKMSQIKSPFGVYGDPVIRHTTNGDILYAHLSNPKGQAYTSDEFLDRIVVQKSVDNGDTWSEGSFPASNRDHDHDKHWVAMDPNSAVVLMSWTEFDKYKSEEPQDRSRILFSKSIDHGNTWSEAISINQFEGNCLDDDQTTEGANPGVGVDGSYYVVWSYDEKIYFDASEDGGKTWLDEDIVVAPQIGGWTFDIPGLGRSNGMPVLGVDHSDGIYRGNVYVNFADQSNGEEDTDIWVARSEDGGKTWEKPVRVNNDKPGKHQFFSWMDVDPITGYIYLVFYDRRNHTDNGTDVYLAYSKDGGKTFANRRISDGSFTPNTSVFFGDYNDISAYGGAVRPIWTEQRGSELSVHTAIVDMVQK